MKTYFQGLTRKSLVIGIGALIIVLGGGTYIYSKNASKNPYEIERASRRDVVQEVSVTGRVKAAENIDLAFEKGGRVAGIYVKVGQKVQRGAVLAELSRGDLAASLAEAEASVRREQAELDELRRGARPEEIKRAEVKVANARVSLEDARRAVSNELANAYTTADDAVRNKVDQIFLNPRSQNPQITISTDLQLKTDLESGRLTIEAMLKTWATASTLSSSDVQKNLTTIKSFVAKAALGVNQLTPNSNITQTTIDKYKTDILAARNTIDDATSGITSAEEKYRTAESTLALAIEDLDVLKAGTSPEGVRAGEADVERAESAVGNIRAEIEKAIIRAPINGIITVEDADTGEIVAANAPLISLISDAEYEIEANVPEVDIAKLKLASKGEATLDAYGDDEKFEASVVQIDPAETIVDGVATYKIVLQFVEQDPRIKSGMTANVDIKAETHANVLAVPQRAVITKEGKKMVRISEGEASYKEVVVKTGLRGSDGYIEILEGISENDPVITSSIEE